MSSFCLLLLPVSLPAGTPFQPEPEVVTSVSHLCSFPVQHPPLLTRPLGKQGVKARPAVHQEKWKQDMYRSLGIEGRSKATKKMRQERKGEHEAELIEIWMSRMATGDRSASGGIFYWCVDESSSPVSCQASARWQPRIGGLYIRLLLESSRRIRSLSGTVWFSQASCVWRLGSRHP